MNLEENRILIADGDNSLSNRLRTYLSESGFETKIVSNGYLLQKTILEWRPHFIIIDLLFPGCYAQSCLKFLSERHLLGEDGIHVIVISSHNDEINVKNCLLAGADDFIVKPLQPIEILHRLALLSRSKQYNFESFVSTKEMQVKNYFEMAQLLVQASAQDKDVALLRLELLQMVSLALKAVRTSIVETNLEKNAAEVIRSCDDPSLTSLKLDLKKYPELQYVLRTEKSLFIDSLEKDQTMAFVKHELKSIEFDSMMLVPLHFGTELKACLSIRMPKDCKKLSFYDIKIAEIAAQLLAITWKFESSQENKKAA